MNVADVLPLEGIRIDGKMIRLGDTLEQVEEALGEPQWVYENRRDYCSQELAVFYDDDECVEFFEFNSGVDGDLQPEIYGVLAFQVQADELLAVLEEKNGPDIENEDDADFSYAFRKIGVGIFRESTPEDIEELLEEAAEEGEPMDPEELAEEQRKVDHWASLGIGGAGYYD